MKKRKIFLDVGGHIGQTLDEVLSGRYSFDKVYCFEPMPVQYNYLATHYSEKGKPYNLEICNFGLLDKSEPRIIYGNNKNMAASIYKDKCDIENNKHETVCNFMEASEFFRKSLADEDLVIMKLNCEGSEVIITNNLIDSGEIWKANNIMIDFDIRKVPGHAREAEILLDRLRKSNFSNYSLECEVMVGKTHQNRIRNWLSTLSFYQEILAR